MSRRGFALVAVLWVLTLAAGIGLSADSGGRDGFDASRNRTAQTAARFTAQGCAARIVAGIARLAVLDTAGVDAERWSNLDATFAELPADLPLDCSARLESGEARADLNTIEEPALRTILESIGSGGDAARVAFAVVEWRNEHGPFRAVEELLLVPGADGFSEALRELGVDVGRIDLLHASESVLLSLPGMVPGHARAIVDRRNSGWRPNDLRDLATLVPHAAAAQFIAAYSEFSLAAQLGPTTWVLTVTASAGRPSIARSEEWQLTRGATGIAVQRRRVW